MDTIPLLIVTIFATAIINGIVSNLIFLRYQKKLEESFAKSRLEYETKYVRNHERMVQTLETLFQRYSGFKLEVHRCVYDTIVSLNRTNNVLEDEIQIRERLNKAFRIVDETFDYHIQNTIYLPKDVASEIRTLLAKSKLVYSLFEMGLAMLDNPESIEYDTLELVMDIWGIESKIDKNKPTMQSFFDGLAATLSNSSDIIEKHYREAVKEN